MRISPSAYAAGRVTKGSTMNLRRRLALLVAVGLTALSATAFAPASAGAMTLPRPFATGDIFATDGGTIRWYDANGASVADILTPFPAIRAIAADGLGRLWVGPRFGPDALLVIDGGGNVTTISPSVTISVNAFTFNAIGNAFVGDWEIGGHLTEFSPAGMFLREVFHGRESDHIDLDSDQCTLWLQRPGENEGGTERWNVCTGLFVDVFHDYSIGVETAQGVRVLPDGSVLINNPLITRFDRAANALRTYTFPECTIGGRQLIAPEALSPDGSSFYARCLGQGMYEVDVATGARIRSLPIGSERPITVMGEFRAGLHPFSGFFAPIDDAPVVNVMKAGRDVAIPFSLHGDKGLDVLVPGYPLVEHGPCDPNAPSDEVEETISARKKALTYDASSGRYLFTFTTYGSWARACKTVTFKFRDGGIVRRVLFRFT
jgi:hypothetical protein